MGASTTMKTLLVAARARPEAWAEMFRLELPDHEIVVAPPPAGEPVAYAVVGKPEAGLLGSLAGLEVVLSLNAGVEHLLASGEVPAGVPIVRMVDDGLVEGMVDWVTAQALAWRRNLFAYRASQREGRWAPYRKRWRGSGPWWCWARARSAALWRPGSRCWVSEPGHGAALRMASPA
jgi:glyoxylate/hydroxypyruvate reductase A